MLRTSGRTGRPAPVVSRRPDTRTDRPAASRRARCLTQIVELRQHRLLGGEPYGSIDVGVDASYDVHRVRGSVGEGLPHLLETFAPMLEVIVENVDRRRQRRTVAGKEDSDLVCRQVAE